MSLVRSALTFVEILQEFAFPLELNLFVIAKAFITLHHLAIYRGNLVKYNTSPDVSILHVVKAFIACTDEVVNVLGISDFHLCSPISCNLELCFFRAGKLSKPVKSNYEWHVTTVLSVQSHTLEVSFSN